MENPTRERFDNRARAGEALHDVPTFGLGIAAQWNGGGEGVGDTSVERGVEWG